MTGGEFADIFGNRINAFDEPVAARAGFITG
jgi:hypothetical protein